MKMKRILLILLIAGLVFSSLNDINNQYEDEEKEVQYEEKKTLDEVKKSQDEVKKQQDEEEKSYDEEEKSYDEEENSSDEEKEVQYEEKKSQDEVKKPQDEVKKSQDEEEKSQDEEEKSQDEEEKSSDEEKEAQYEEKKSQDEVKKSQDEEEKSQDENEPSDEEEKPSDEEEKYQDEVKKSQDEEEKSQDEESFESMFHPKIEILKQGTYKKLKLNPKNVPYFTFEVNGLTVENQKVKSVCSDRSQLFDTYYMRCVEYCGPQKVKNFINGSCQSKDEIESEIKNISGVFTSDKLNVFSEEQMEKFSYTEYENYKIYCPLIDLKTRACLNSFEECTGFVTESKFCKQCDCNNLTQQDKSCVEKCACKKIFFEDPNNGKLVCQDHCIEHSSQGRFLQYGQLCIREKTCPFYIIDFKVCSPSCGPLHKVYFNYDSDDKRCKRCSRIEKNGLCSDLCPKFDQVLIKDQANQFKCEDKFVHRELALFKGKGCSYPLVLSEDGRECLKQCPAGQKKVFINETSLNKCISSKTCEPGYYESSDGQKCVKSCSRILETQIGDSMKCTNCGNSTSISYSAYQKFECKNTTTIKEDIKSLNSFLEELYHYDFMFFYDIIKTKLVQIFNKIQEIPSYKLEDRYNKTAHFQEYFRMANTFQYWKQYFFVNNLSFYYNTLRSAKGYGIEDLDANSDSFKQYYLIQNGTISVQFELNTKSAKNGNHLEILRFDHSNICFTDSCLDITMFIGIKQDWIISAEFFVSPLSFISGSGKNAYCVREKFSPVNPNQMEYSVSIDLAIQANNNVFTCKSDIEGGVGFVLLTNEQAAKLPISRSIPNTLFDRI